MQTVAAVAEPIQQPAVALHRNGIGEVWRVRSMEWSDHVLQLPYLMIHEDCDMSECLFFYGLTRILQADWSGGFIFFVFITSECVGWLAWLGEKIASQATMHIHNVYFIPIDTYIA